MSGGQSANSVKRYGQRRAVNLYQDTTLEMWDRVEKAVREKYDAADATQGEIAAQAWAEWLGQPGPLESGCR